MQENEKSIKVEIIKYAITNGIALLFVLVLLLLRDAFNETDKQQLYNSIADSFTIPGVLLLCLAALIGLTNQGSLDAIGYMLKRFFQMLIPFSKKEHQKYADYVASKNKVHGYSFLAWSGLVYLIIAIIFIILFYTV